MSGQTLTIERAVREIQDRNAINDVLTRYCRALDWLSRDLLETVFHPDAMVDFGFFAGPAKEFMNVVLGIQGSAAGCWHLTANVAIDLQGDDAEVESYTVTQGRQVLDQGFQDNFYGGRYVDRMQRRNGEWRLLRRHFMLDFQHSIPVGAFTGTVPLHQSERLSPFHPLFRRLHAAAI